MSVIWSGITDTGAVVPVQVTAEGKVVATSGSGVDGYGAVAWASFAGPGAVISDGKNIESISRESDGNYRVSFKNPLPNALYAVTGTASGRVFTVTKIRASFFEFGCYELGGTVFRDLSSTFPNSFVVFSSDQPSLASGPVAQKIKDAVVDKATKGDPSVLPFDPDSETQVVVTPDNSDA